MNVIQGDNLAVMDDLIEQGKRYDLIELDGPYGAGLEDWDNLTEAEYIEHYAARLARVRDLLEPWGAVFVFGYPEGCAEIKSWAHRTNTLYLRRWLTWYKQVTAHKGRKVETILFFLRGNPTGENLAAFGHFLKMERQRRGWSLRDVAERAAAAGYERPWWHRGGNLYFETGSGGAPSGSDLAALAKIFNFDPATWAHVTRGSYEGLTEIDYISRTYPEETDKLNDAGLRSKPVGLYLDLFRSVVPEDESGRALILYGGSGNAGIAAEALGLDVDLIERDPARVGAIRRRAERLVPRWTTRELASRSQLKLPEAEQAALF